MKKNTQPLLLTCLTLLLVGFLFRTVIAASTIFASVLPASRAVAVNGTATAFATLINAGASDATDCAIQLPAAIPATFTYQTTDSATNALTGTPNTPVPIAIGAAQSFVFGITPTTTFPETDIPLQFSCSSGESVTPISGVNTFLLTASTQPTPDIVTLAATVSNDGVVRTGGINSTGAFAVSTVNVGAAGPVIASVDTGAATVPATFTICQTNVQATCLQPPSATVSTSFNPNEAGTFSIFVTAGATAIPLDPANTRAFVRFKSAGGDSYGATSVALTTGEDITIVLNETYDPVSDVSIEIPDVAPALSGAIQIGGPAVGALSYDNGILRFITPRDVGESYDLLFRLGGDSRTYKVPFASRIPSPTFNDGEEECNGDDQSCSHISPELQPGIQGLEDGILLPGIPAVLSFHVKDGSSFVALDENDIELTLGGMDNDVDITPLFQLAADKTRLELKLESRSSLLSMLKGADNVISFSGAVVDGRFFSVKFNLFWGNKSLTGRLADENNAPLSAEPGMLISATDQDTGFNTTVSLDSGGTYSIINLPKGTYLLKLLDPLRLLQGTGLAVIDDADPQPTADIVTTTIPANLAQSSTLNISTQSTNKNCIFDPAPVGTSDCAFARASANRVDATTFVEQRTESVTVTFPQGTQIINAFGTCIFNRTDWGFATCKGSCAVSWSCANSKFDKSEGYFTVKRSIDLTKATEKHSIQCSAIATADSRVIDDFGGGSGCSYITTAAVGFQSAPLGIKKFIHKSGMFKNVKKEYVMGVPTASTPGTRQHIIASLEYLPKNLDTSNLKLNLTLTSGNKDYVINDNMPHRKLADGKLQVDLVMPELKISPADNQMGQLTATLTATINGKIVTASSNLTFPDAKPDLDDKFHVLLETRSINKTPESRRYLERNDNVGGDGWAKTPMLNLLKNESFIFGDVSGEHSYQMPCLRNPSAMCEFGIHAEHKTGLTVDGFYMTDECKHSETLGNGQGNNSASIKNMVIEASNEQAQGGQTFVKRNVLVQWLTCNQQYLNHLLTTYQGTRKILVGKAPWFVAPWFKGKTPVGGPIMFQDSSNPSVIKQFVPSNDSRIIPATAHEGHFHLSMDPP